MEVIVNVFKYLCVTFLLLLMHSNRLSVHGYNVKCSEYCTCSNENKTITADCQFQHLNYFPDIQWTKVNRLLLSGNLIQTIKSSDLESHRHLRSLQMAFNNVDYIEDKAFQLMSKIESINLDYNQLTDLNVYSFINARPTSSLGAAKLFISIFHNPIMCSCSLNAKVNTIKNKNRFIDKLFVTCFQDYTDSTPVEVQSYAASNCDPLQNYDDLYTVATTQVITTTTKQSTSSSSPTPFVTTQVNDPPLKTSEHPPSNKSEVYPTLNISNGQITVKLWHLVALVLSAVVVSVVVIIVCYLILSRICHERVEEKLSRAASPSYYSNRESYPTMNGLGSNMSNGYSRISLYQNVTLPNHYSSYQPPPQRHPQMPYPPMDISLSYSEINRQGRTPRPNALTRRDSQTSIVPTVELDDFPDFSKERQRNSLNAVESSFSNARDPMFVHVGHIRPNKDNGIFFSDVDDPGCNVNFDGYVSRTAGSNWI